MIEVISSPTVIALGFFDGVHLGHVSLINKAKELAVNGVKSVVYTFDTHPSSFFGSLVPMITPGDDRISVLKSFQTDYVYVQEITPEFLNISPEDFVSEILIKKLGAVHIISGENYTFGKNKSGNPEILNKLCDAYGIKYTVLPFCTDNGDIISSSLIRSLLSEGKIERANRILGRPFAISGEVVHCRNVGHTLGFPTANILPRKDAQLPLPGVYATNTVIKGKSYSSVTNVGSAPTFSENKIIIESHILDFDKDIYSEEIRIDFLKLIRKQQKFSSAHQLAEQLNKDCIIRRKI